MTIEGLLYEQLAREFEASIGALRPGDRLPSVRALAERRGVSVSTAVAAYRSLENAGLIEARPKSGYFVRARRLSLAEPRAARRATAPQRPSVASAVEALQASMRDPSVVPLGSAWLAPELLPVGQLNRTLSAITREMASVGATYEASPGLLTLRRQLARRSLDWGCSLGEDELLTTVGATEAIHLSLGAVARAGDTIAVESPTYFGILQAIEALGMKALEIPASARTGLDLDALAEALRTTPVRAVVAVTNASNPLGAVMPDEAKERLVRMLARHDVPLIEDDAYGDLVFDGPRPRVARAFDREGRVLLCGSVSKTLAPGYRVGWVAPGRYLDAVRRRQYAQTLACSTPPQMAVAEMLATGGYERHLRRLRRAVAVQVERVRDAVGARFPEGTRVSAPRGGFVLWVELPQNVSALQLQAEALQRGVVVAPGPIFSARGRFGHCVRLSCGLPWSARLDDAISQLAELTHAQRNRARAVG